MLIFLLAGHETTVNLIAILMLSGLVVRLTRDYFDQRKAGKTPTFIASSMPELKGQIDAEIWSRN